MYNPYYSNINTPIYSSSLMSRNRQDTYQHVFQAMLARIKNGASAIDFYSRLINMAPNQKHKNNIRRALEGKKTYFKQLTDLYINFTRSYPVYPIAKVNFHNYIEGLQKAYEAEVESYQESHTNYLLSQHPLVQDVYLQALTTEKENARRFGLLTEEVLNEIRDFGGEPFVINIDEATKKNNTYRTALWTGNHFQVTLMSIDVGDDIGLEIHPTTDQFIRIEEGQGLVQMGDTKDQLRFQKEAYDGFAVMIPAGKWHNITNTGNKPLKLYVLYAPPQHLFGTVHKTKADAIAEHTIVK